MNWTRALRDVATDGDTSDELTLTALMAHDTVYMPSELAARLLPVEARRADDLVSRDRSAQSADLRAPAH